MAETTAVSAPCIVYSQCRELSIYGPVDLLSLEFYRLAKKHALDERGRVSKLLSSVNTVLDKYGSEFEDLSRDIYELKLAIRRATKGEPDTEGQNSPKTVNIDDRDTERYDAAHMLQCKKFYKVLAQAHHPDKGGSVEVFQAVKQAYADGDLDFLRIQWILLDRERDYSWRCLKGVEFWVTQVEKATINLKRLQSLPMFLVVSYHMAGNYVAAKSAMLRELQARKSRLINELNFIVQSKRLFPEIEDGKSEGKEKEGRVTDEDDEEVSLRED